MITVGTSDQDLAPHEEQKDEATATGIEMIIVHQSHPPLHTTVAVRVHLDVMIEHQNMEVPRAEK